MMPPALASFQNLQELSTAADTAVVNRAVLLLAERAASVTRL